MRKCPVLNFASAAGAAAALLFYSGAAYAAGSGMPWEQPLQQVLRSVDGRVPAPDPDRLRPLHRLCGLEFLPELLQLRRWSAGLVSGEHLPGFEVPLHRSPTEPLPLAGAPRNIAILNGTIAAALGLGLQMWLAG